MTDSKTCYPWREGNYRGEGLFESIILSGNKGTSTTSRNLEITFESGDFGEADDEVIKMTGQMRYTAVMRYKKWETDMMTKCVLSEDGRKFFFKSTLKTVPIGVLEWITQEEADIIANDGDSIEAPSSHYKLEPERQGKIIWIIGAPGLGKSTTAQLLSRNHGYVYYEGDCFFGLRNPYIPPDVPEASLAQLKQKKLVGEEAKERQELVKKIIPLFSKIFTSGTVGLNDMENNLLEEGYRAMCNNIKKERKRLGGDWAISCVLLTRKIRDIVRSEMGSNLQIVSLDMSLEDQMARVRSRHLGDQHMVDMFKVIYDMCEPAGDKEPNIVEVKVTPDKTPDDILNMVLEKVNMVEENEED